MHMAAKHGPRRPTPLLMHAQRCSGAPRNLGACMLYMFLPLSCSRDSKSETGSEPRPWHRIPHPPLPPTHPPSPPRLGHTLSCAKVVQGYLPHLGPGAAAWLGSALQVKVTTALTSGMALTSSSTAGAAAAGTGEAANGSGGSGSSRATVQLDQLRRHVAALQVKGVGLASCLHMHGVWYGYTSAGHVYDAHQYPSCPFCLYHVRGMCFQADIIQVVSGPLIPCDGCMSVTHVD